MNHRSESLMNVQKTCSVLAVIAAVTILTSCGAKVERRDSALTIDCPFISAEQGTPCEQLEVIHVRNELANAKCNERMQQIRSGW